LEFKEYIGRVPQEVRDEVVEFRRQVAILNKQKRTIYKALSQEAQSYLKQEQDFKKRLPVNQKSLINPRNPGQRPAPDLNSPKA
jgi:hypothetical protein